MGGSCINSEVEHLDKYRRGWQVLSLDKALSPAETRCLERLYVQFVCVSLSYSSLSLVFFVPSHSNTFNVAQCF